MNGKLGLYERGLDLAQRVGPVCGGAAGICYAAAYGYPWLLDVLSPEAEGSRSDFAQMAFGVGFAFVAMGLGRALKKQSDMFVASEAEKRIQNPALNSMSAVPQIQKEIDKQQSH